MPFARVETTVTDPSRFSVATLLPNQPCALHVVFMSMSIAVNVPVAPPQKPRKNSLSSRRLRISVRGFWVGPFALVRSLVRASICLVGDGAKDGGGQFEQVAARGGRDAGGCVCMPVEPIKGVDHSRGCRAPQRGQGRL